MPESGRLRRQRLGSHVVSLYRLRGVAGLCRSLISLYRLAQCHPFVMFRV